MKHYLKSKDGEFRFEVDMGCGYPSETTDNTCPTRKGNCEECCHGKATIRIADLMELMKRADCTNLQ